MTRWLFWFSLARHRHGNLPWVSLLLLASGAVLHGYLVPGAERTLAQQVAAFAQAAAAASEVRDTALTRQAEHMADLRAAQQRRDDFEALLLTPHAMTGVQSRILGLAQSRQLAMGPADYRTISGILANAQTIEIRMPVRGSYAQVRGFVADVLTHMPALALRDVQLRRASVTEQQIEAQLVWIVFLRKGPI